MTLFGGARSARGLVSAFPFTDCMVKVLLMLSLALAATQLSQGLAFAKPCPAQNPDPGLLADDATDVHAVDAYKAAVAHMLEREEFKDLDCLADALRSSKARFAGGMWKLHTLYGGLESPLGHPTEKDWRIHLNRLKHWVEENPGSITARIALAESQVNYAWDARGEEAADTVTNNGWQLFAKRAKEGRKTLEQASTLGAQCPEWYVAMESVALAQGWEGKDARALVERSLALEPEYYYVYRLYALYLLPKWYGADGDTERFAAGIADQIGGARGDAVYFEIAGFLTCNCNDQPQLSRMAWPRIQNGFAVLDKQYGASLTNLNLLAHMAIKLKDAVVADRMFKRIGNQWSEATWRRQANFEESRTWSAQVAPGMQWQRSVEDEAEANRKAAGGSSYQAAFEQAFATYMRQCVQAPGADQLQFEMLIQVGEGGTIKQLQTSPSTAVSQCLLQNLMTLQMQNTIVFPRPPKAPYWIQLNLDPASYSSARTPGTPGARPGLGD